MFDIKDDREYIVWEKEDGPEALEALLTGKDGQRICIQSSHEADPDSGTDPWEQEAVGILREEESEGWFGIYIPTMWYLSGAFCIHAENDAKTFADLTRVIVEVEA